MRLPPDKNAIYIWDITQGCLQLMLRDRPESKLEEAIYLIELFLDDFFYVPQRRYDMSETGMSQFGLTQQTVDEIRHLLERPLLQRIQRTIVFYPSRSYRYKIDDEGYFMRIDEFKERPPQAFIPENIESEEDGWIPERMRRNDNRR